MLVSISGICKVRYTSPLCASYARERLDGFNYGGMPLQVNFGKTEEIVAYVARILFKIFFMFCFQKVHKYTWELDVC